VDTSEEVEPHPLVKCITVVFVALFAIYGLWATVIAFVGGTLPIIGVALPGGIISGLLWLFIADPILMGLGYLLSLIIILPIHALISWLQH
jgi:hypothetical protein